VQKSSSKEVQRSRSRSLEKKVDERETNGDDLRYHGDTYSPTQQIFEENPVSFAIVDEKKKNSN
jgi:hypothetical protein